MQENLKVVENQQEQEDEGNLFFGGLPTNIELAKLREAYPEGDLKVGDFIPYHEVEKLLGLTWDSSRFKTVTNRWRRVIENETNIFIHPDPGKGFIILSEPEKLSLSGKQIKSAGKKARRSFVINSRVNRKELTDNQKALSDHLSGVAAKMHASSQIKKRLELPQL